MGLEGAAITVYASGFLDPSQNSNGPAFGLWVTTPAGGPMIELPEGTLGINGVTNNTFSIYPNPTTNMLTVNGVDTQNLRFTMVDMQGRVVKDGDLFARNTASLSQGLYVLNLIDNNRVVSAQKFIKE